jgi:hypothetical protein
MGGMPENLDNDGVLRAVREVDWAADPSPYHRRHGGRCRGGGEPAWI